MNGFVKRLHKTSIYVEHMATIYCHIFVLHVNIDVILDHPLKQWPGCALQKKDVNMSDLPRSDPIPLLSNYF